MDRLFGFGGLRIKNVALFFSCVNEQIVLVLTHQLNKLRQLREKVTWRSV